jgi:hypothetical protein
VVRSPRSGKYPIDLACLCTRRTGQENLGVSSREVVAFELRRGRAPVVPVSIDLSMHHRWLGAIFEPVVGNLKNEMLRGPIYLHVRREVGERWQLMVSSGVIGLSTLLPVIIDDVPNRGKERINSR